VSVTGLRQDETETILLRNRLRTVDDLRRELGMHFAHHEFDERLPGRTLATRPIAMPIEQFLNEDACLSRYARPTVQDLRHRGSRYGGLVTDGRERRPTLLFSGERCHGGFSPSSSRRTPLPRNLSYSVLQHQ